MPIRDRLSSHWISGPVIAFIVVLGLLAALQLVQVDFAIGNVVIHSQRGATYPMANIEGMVKVAAARPHRVPDQDVPAAPTPPRNLIIVLGDGMGLGQLSTASSLLFGPGGGLAVEDAQAIGLSRVWALDDLETDSAAAGTAIACGYRTTCAKVGMLPDGRRVKNLFEAARENGLATALLTTSYVMDATTACFSAHAASRKQYADILAQIMDSGHEIVLGGDSKIPWDCDDEPMPTVAERINDPTGRDFTLVTTEEELATATGRILGLFPSRNGDPSYHGPLLAHSTRRILELLDTRESGFAVLVESEITDAAGHGNDIGALVEGVRELDAAIRVAVDFAAHRGDTLVVVVADHATGVPGIVRGMPEEGAAHIRWLTADHSGHWLPVFAFGPGAEAFRGVFDAAQIGPTIAALMGFENYPAILP